jgi:hypothetical protein
MRCRILLFRIVVSRRLFWGDTSVLGGRNNYECVIIAVKKMSQNSSNNDGFNLTQFPYCFCIRQEAWVVDRQCAIVIKLLLWSLSATDSIIQPAMDRKKLAC